MRNGVWKAGRPGKRGGHRAIVRHRPCVSRMGRVSWEFSGRKNGWGSTLKRHSKPMSHEKVLIVEDEENERSGLAELVSSWGYRVETAAHGRPRIVGPPGGAGADDCRHSGDRPGDD